MTDNQSNSNKKVSLCEKMFGFVSEDIAQDGLSDKVGEKIYSIKLEDRTYLNPNAWSKYNYASSPICDLLLHLQTNENVQRIHYKDLSVEEFWERYEKKNIPVVIEGLTEEMNVEKNWTFEAIFRNHKNDKFKIGEDNKGRSLRCRLKYFYEYMLHQTDDSPLYLFEPDIDEEKEFRPLLENYTVPKYFKEDDYFKIVGEDKRPPHKWFLIGPKRSGSTVHVDPIKTSAWNLSFQGHKRWVLFPNEIPKSIVKGKEFIEPGYDDEAIVYFDKILPKIKAKEGDNLKIIEFTQRPGDLIFVPGGWWHAVLNLDNTMAVTQNFMSRNNFDKVWRSFRKGRKKLSGYFLKKAQTDHPELYNRALELNKQDGFVMHSEKILNNVEGVETIEKKVKVEQYVPSSSSSSSTDSSSESDSTSSSSEEENTKESSD